MSRQIHRIGCIGAGALGAAIIERLATLRKATPFWNRNIARGAPLNSHGALQMDHPAAVAQSSDVIITCVSDSTAVEEVVFGPNGVSASGNPEKILIDMSTCSIDHTRAMAKRLMNDCGMPWLDAPISGGPPAAREGRMAIMVGGDPAVFERAQPVWDALARRATLMGPQGAGQATKMINQVLVATGIAALAEACALAERLGIDATKIPAALAGGRADSTQLQELFPRMANSEFGVTARMQLLLKDLNLLQKLADENDASVPLTSTARSAFAEMVSQGLGDHDNTELVRRYRK